MRWLIRCTVKNSCDFNVEVQQYIYNTSVNAAGNIIMKSLLLSFSAGGVARSDEDAPSELPDRGWSPISRGRHRVPGG